MNFRLERYFILIYNDFRRFQRYLFAVKYLEFEIQ